MKHVGLLVVCLALALGLAARARALDDTEPVLRWGGSIGLVGSLPIGDTRGPAAQDDVHVMALSVLIEPVTFEVRDRWVLTPYASFAILGGVDEAQVNEALDPARRTDISSGEPLADPERSMIQLGLKARYFLLASKGWLRPYVSLGLGYATRGARYQAGPSSLEAVQENPRLAAGSLEVHRHRGIALPLGLGVRHDAPLTVFNSDFLIPIALELAYTHNFWLSLQRNDDVERMPEQLVGEKPFLDSLGILLSIGFLR